MTLASIMMVTYNRWELTKQTLDNIVETTHYPFELIVVDNKSTDATKISMCDYINNLFPPNIGFQIIYNAENKGIAIARNQALHAAKGDYLVTLDNDVLLSNGWLNDCIAILEANKSFGMMGVNFEPVKYPLIKQGDLEWQEKKNGNLGTACTVFHRSLHKLLGYYNTEYQNYGHEDADMGMRVRMLGLKMGYLKENGTHLGEGINDMGEYREFKNKHGQANLAKFHTNCRLYASKAKSLYID